MGAMSVATPEMWQLLSSAPPSVILTVFLLIYLRDRRNGNGKTNGKALLQAAVAEAKKDQHDILIAVQDAKYQQKMVDELGAIRDTLGRIEKTGLVACPMAKRDTDA